MYIYIHTVNENLFIDFFLGKFIIGIKKLPIFEYWFCILLLCFGFAFCYYAYLACLKFSDELFRVFIDKTMLSTNKDALTSYFPAFIPFAFLFYCSS